MCLKTIIKCWFLAGLIYTLFKSFFIEVPWTRLYDFIKYFSSQKPVSSAFVAKYLTVIDLFGNVHIQFDQLSFCGMLANGIFGQEGNPIPLATNSVITEMLSISTESFTLA